LPNKTVRYIGGPLDGRTEPEYAPEAELTQMLAEGYVFDWTPASVCSGAKDVIERYQLERWPSGWVFHYTGEFERPALERNIDVTFHGGPRDGETAVFLGSIRDRRELATSHYPGYILHHEGSNPLTGWTMRLIA
jgi:hypothetical protein